MDNPSTWAVIWLVIAAVFGVGEMAIAGSFFLAPFAIGAAVAAVASLFGAPVLLSWALFVGFSLVAFLALKPIAKRLDEDLPNPQGFGANRLIGSDGIVEDTIPGGDVNTGMVRIAGERWRAEGQGGMGITAGTPVRIVEVRGTRVVVVPANQAGLDELGPPSM